MDKATSCSSIPGAWDRRVIGPAAACADGWGCHPICVPLCRLMSIRLVCAERNVGKLRTLEVLRKSSKRSLHFLSECAWICPTQQNQRRGVYGAISTTGSDNYDPTQQYSTDDCVTHARCFLLVLMGESVYGCALCMLSVVSRLVYACS